MVIDLSTCVGCNSCIVACQAENNIPVVGKEQVARSREMHWLRVDAYFRGAASNPSGVYFMPYQDWETPSLKMLRNPQVSVRSRGVMEKCTYCVQRISTARIDAEREG